MCDAVAEFTLPASRIMKSLYYTVVGEKVESVRRLLTTRAVGNSSRVQSDGVTDLDL